MSHPVIAIGLDSAEPALLEKWMDAGHLPTLQRLREQGAYGRLANFKDSNVETAWTTFSTGCRPETTGYWAAMGLKDGTYETETRAAYDYQEIPPFMALGDDYRVAVFDVPQLRIHSRINGVQIAAWGAHSPQVPSGSSPEHMFQEMVDKHGNHPGLHNDYAVCLDLDATMRLEDRFEKGIARRGAICCDLLQRENWDLLLTVFSEPHSGGHVFWHLSQPDHPLYEAFKDRVDHDPLLASYQAIDRAIASMIDAAPEDATVVLFSAHGTGAATIDVPTFAVLPEFLYRYSFPGKHALAYSEITDPLPPPCTKMDWNYWERHLWSTKYDPNPITKFLRKYTPTRIFNILEPWLDKNDKTGLKSPFRLRREGERVVPWTPAQWYKAMWPQMKAFAVPSFAEGYVRINLKGREPQGVVDPSEYESVCDDICEKLHQLTDPRTGKPMVDRIVRTRKDASDRNPKLPDPDLIIVWQEEFVTDVMDSPEYGRFGPMPPYRAGSHRANGFMLAVGPDIQPGSTVENGHALDIAPTILALMGAPIADHMEGKPVFMPQKEMASTAS